MSDRHPAGGLPEGDLLELGAQRSDMMHLCHKHLQISKCSGRIHVFRNMSFDGDDVANRGAFHSLVFVFSKSLKIHFLLSYLTILNDISLQQLFFRFFSPELITKIPVKD